MNPTYSLYDTIYSNAMSPTPFDGSPDPAHPTPTMMMAMLGSTLLRLSHVLDGISTHLTTTTDPTNQPQPELTDPIQSLLTKYKNLYQIHAKIAHTNRACLNDQQKQHYHFANGALTILDQLLPDLRYSTPDHSGRLEPPQ